MNLIVSAGILIFTLLVVPLASWLWGIPLGARETHVLWSLGIMTTGVIAWCFLIGELTGNNSQVDKLWSLVPILYVWTVASYGHFGPRLLVMAVLVSFWGARLTFNFGRHGAYQWRFWGGTEDYRWKVLRQKPEFQPKWRWTLFNLFFISGYQNILILLFTLPAIVALQFQNKPLNWLDGLAALAFLGFLGLETVADNQHWRFQSRKWSRIKSGQELNEQEKKGFLDRGLWGRSRHPNYFAEQAIWVSFYFFSVAASGQWVNWSVAGCLLLMVLFYHSSRFSEEISAGKYPQYADYQKQVPRFWPLGRKSG